MTQPSIESRLEVLKDEISSKVGLCTEDGEHATTGFDACQNELLPLLKAAISNLHNLVDRIDRNGGLGEYNGGPAFVLKDTREFLAEVENFIKGVK